MKQSSNRHAPKKHVRQHGQMRRCLGQANTTGKKPRPERVLKRLVEDGICAAAAGREATTMFRSFQIAEIVVMMRLSGERGWRMALAAEQNGVCIRFVPIAEDNAEKTGE